MCLARLYQPIHSLDELVVGERYFWCSNGTRYDFHSGYYTGRTQPGDKSRVEMHEDFCWPMGPNSGVWDVSIKSLYRHLPPASVWYRQQIAKAQQIQRPRDEV